MHYHAQKSRLEDVMRAIERDYTHWPEEDISRLDHFRRMIETKKQHGYLTFERILQTYNHV